MCAKKKLLAAFLFSVVAVLIPYAADALGQASLARDLVGFVGPGVIAVMWASGSANAYEGFNGSDPHWLTSVIVYGVSIVFWFLVAMVVLVVGNAIKRMIGRKKIG